MVAAVGPTVAAVAVQPDGGAPAAGPACSDWMTNEFDVSLSTSPPEMATVPVGQLAVAVAGMMVVVPTGSPTGGAATTWAPSDFQDTAAGARLVPATAPAPSAGPVTDPGASDAFVTAPVASLLELTEPFASLAVITEFAASRVESIAPVRDLLAAHRPVGEGAAVQHAPGERRTARREHERDECDDGCRTGACAHESVVHRSSSCEVSRLGVGL